MSVEEKIKQLGLNIPEAPKPVASYVPAVKSGNLIFTSGQLPFVNGNLQYIGKLGEKYSIEDGYQAARICVLNCLSVVKGIVGDLDKVARIVKVVGFVSSAAGFNDQPKVINGASELLGEIFGEAGQHARSAVGVNELPLNSAVEVEMIVEIK